MTGIKYGYIGYKTTVFKDRYHDIHAFLVMVRLVVSCSRTRGTGVKENHDSLKQTLRIATKFKEGNYNYRLLGA